MASAATTGAHAAAAASSSGPPPSATHSAALRKLMLSLAPPLSSSVHKGQSGRVGVMGGSTAYTGAPYFAAMTPLLMGADLSTVFCSVEAGVAIKSYSPDLMVRPCLFPSHLVDDALAQMDTKGPLRSKEDKESAAISAIVSDVSEWSARMDVMVLGPGLGKDDLMMRTAAAWLLKHAAQADSKASSSSSSSCSSAAPPCPVVLDGDALHMLTDYAAEAVAGGPAMILTPNAMEFRRLWTRFMRGDASSSSADSKQQHDSPPPPPAFDLAIDPAWLEANPDGGVIPSDHPYARDTALLARALHGSTIVRKGAVDVISDGGAYAAVVTSPGCPRRVGGQGDLLAGATGLFVAWTNIKAERSKQHQPQQQPQGPKGKQSQEPHEAEETAESASSSSSSQPLPDSLLAAYAASHFCRALQRAAYASHGRSMLASNLIEAIPAVMQQLYPLDGVSIQRSPAAAAAATSSIQHKL